ncbi:PREDICTED: iron-sulfur cluster assembly 2 homolog, mitochondrial-like [Amphimedon queenslandica]|uniref:Iron-sulfur cluster assembly 2 homolog, mitochondrial n=1 Tax=Amphimedon queenslandica TaxID=400682 RepID=A0A1X7VN15_AMPQE|nr:PREDICTED: iron-sulfur cluster assembly 2 homolog, mitochondrial-like [Amphimedon queenslandica]|eukprot:XP_003383760.1 PREDICTED: iron-sulfur cluster assembly 2 homolog, mitochondrial-like [Amphimedon queenslandica]
MASWRKALFSISPFIASHRVPSFRQSRVFSTSFTSTRALNKRYGWVYSSFHRLQSSQTASSTQPITELSLSDSCVKRLLTVSETPDTMLRVMVEGGGCSGFQYKFSFDTTVNKDDKIFEREGARVVIDELSLSFLSGSTIDYHQEMIRSSFRVIGNPQMEMGCSCGASFSLK